jgi:hypothetical protein
MFNNRESKYNFSFERTLNNAMYVKSCFVTLVKSNVKQSKVNPCERCIVHVAIN